MAATRTWTAEDLQSLPDDGNRYEVLDGELLVTPAPALRHQNAVLLIARRIADFLDRERIAYVAVAPADVAFSNNRLVQPDVFVTPLVAGRQPITFADAGHLMVAVEVLSPSTARVDRVKKRAVYREEGVDEYWIVDCDARVIERSTPHDARIDVLSDELIWTPMGATSAFVLDLGEYFRKVLDD